MTPMGETKSDPEAPLTVQELLAMQKQYAGRPIMQRVIAAALKRRLEVPAEVR